MKKLGAIILLTAAGTALGAERLSTVSVYGLKVPGTPEIAKEQGFTDCKDNYSSYVCTHTKPTVVAGINAKSAAVFFDGSDHFSEKNRQSSRKVTDFPPEKLTYGGVRLEFEDRYAFKEALASDGWLETSSGNSAQFYKSGVAASFSMYKSAVSLSPLSLKEVEEQVSTLKAKQAEKAKSESNSTSFIESMKK